MKPHLVLMVRVAISMTDYELRGLPASANHKALHRLNALADTGAMMVVMGMCQAEELGVHQEELLPTTVSIQVANGVTEQAKGMIILHITCKDGTGRQRSTCRQAYVMEGTRQLFLSQEALEELGSIKEGVFPQPQVEQCQVMEMGSGDEEASICPARSLPPMAPSTILYEPTEGNIEKVRVWIVEHFRSSAFNNCTHQKLPLVQGSPPLRLHLDESVKSVACHKASNIPLHFVDQVKADLDRDERLRVIRKVPVNTLVDSFLSRIVVATKKSGKPRRTVDFKALNRACLRQTHSVEPLFWQANEVPCKTWKTCLDTKEGYHSIPIAEEDKKHTVFLTPWGRYEYLVTPQGHLSAGDGPPL